MDLDIRHLVAQVMRFGLVGITASLVHWSVVTGLVSTGIGEPLWMNIIGFLCAFSVSYIGHRHWTFCAGGDQSLKKFFAVSLLGFALNEATFAVLLAMGVPYQIGLLIAIIVAAASTFVLSKTWAFR